MELHHSKHHQTYVNGLNDAEEKYATAAHSKDVTAQIALQPLLKFHRGFIQLHFRKLRTPRIFPLPPLQKEVPVEVLPPPEPCPTASTAFEEALITSRRHLTPLLLASREAAELAVERQGDWPFAYHQQADIDMHDF
ncbi:Superoxide dismutase [Mn], mitochondrial [Rhizina undulata]